MGKIKVIIKEPGKDPRSVWISNSLKNLQNTVDGFIETVTLTEDLVIICNEEGRIQNLPYCCTIGGIKFVGTVIFSGYEEDEFTDIPYDFKKFKTLFPEMWEI